LLAKNNLPEFSYSTETDNLLTGRSNNPWNLARTPGGSSGGHEGLPIGVQLVTNWWAESTVLHLAALLETVRPVRDLPPAI
jgi:Asp-tRNA(Asn)/Glu-tRNA(Gln) amidotransferase A subunit family amidase